jgi:hypothetical protein
MRSSDLPADDDSAGLSEYTEAVVSVLGDRTDLVVVAQSLAAFVAPMLAIESMSRSSSSRR